ncbi:MAG: hypothetical protein PHP93_08850 [Kiritimatiellales bacterium]|nr:hypothetical protein [Kiritimatiellales bacterium]
MIRWADLSKKQKQLALLMLGLAVAQAALMIHLLESVAGRGSSAGKELAMLEQEAEDARTILGQEASIWQNLKQSAAELDALIQYTPAQADRYAWAYEYISSCAARTQITLDIVEEINLSPDDKTGVAGPPFEIQLFTRCGYNNLVEFIWRLEKNNPLLRIKKVTIAAVPGFAQAPQIQIAVQWPTSVKIAGKVN